MDAANSWAMGVIAPEVLLIVLLWLVIRTPSGRTRRNKERSQDAARVLYRDEEQRWRDRTDEL